MSDFTEVQPKDGEILVHCGHLDVTTPHFTRFEPPIEFESPDGEKGKASWFIECDACIAERMKTGSGMMPRGHATWMGDEPVIKKAPSLN